MILVMQIAGGMALGLIAAFFIIDYFEEILLTTTLFLGLGLAMMWVLSHLEGDIHILKKMALVLRPLF
ncbi:MAG: hypothetical protein KDD35_04530 [Bdellovibrionales bacterium]|nr:hypothetical protein [Bdellovibrionales bacterium]